MNKEFEKPTIIEVFNDDGSHSHWALIRTETGEKIWSENPQECKAMGYPVIFPSPERGKEGKVGEEIIKRAAEILLQAEDKGITSCQQKMRVVFETLNTEGLSMQQGRGEEWISVEERLPITEIDKAEQVIVLSDKKDGSKPLVICAVFWNGNFYLQESWGHKETKSPLLKYTTHWQPLPPFTQSKGTE